MFDVHVYVDGGQAIGVHALCSCHSRPPFRLDDPDAIQLGLQLSVVSPYSSTLAVGIKWGMANDPSRRICKPQ
jgi:hypothetical protein